MATTFEKTDCLCGDNKHKGWLNERGGMMLCENCDVDGCNARITQDVKSFILIHGSSKYCESEIDMCEVCNTEVFVDVVDNQWTIANCDFCDKMACRACLEPPPHNGSEGCRDCFRNTQGVSGCVNDGKGNSKYCEFEEGDHEVGFVSDGKGGEAQCNCLYCNRYECLCGENIEDKYRCDDCGYCCNPSKSHRCCECES
jgi:hypothetical protein